MWAFYTLYHYNSNISKVLNIWYIESNLFPLSLWPLLNLLSLTPLRVIYSSVAEPREFVDLLKLLNKNTCKIYYPQGKCCILNTMLLRSTSQHYNISLI